MRALAAELRTGPMTLYNYVRDREGLETLIVDAVMAEARLPEARSGDWRADVRLIAEAGWRAVRAHPHVIPLILTRRSRHEATLDFAEALLSALAASGRSGIDLLAAFRIVMGFITGLAQAHLSAGVAGSGAMAPVDPAIAEVQALAPERYPRLIDIAGSAERIGPDGEFRAGLEIIIAGLAGSADGPPS